MTEQKQPKFDLLVKLKAMPPKLRWGVGGAIVVLGGLAFLFGAPEKKVEVEPPRATIIDNGDTGITSGIPRDAANLLNELLRQKNGNAEEQRRQAEEWTGKYRELEKNLAKASVGDKRPKQALAFLQHGKLDDMRAILYQLIDKEVSQTDMLAANYYNLALSWHLVFDYAKAQKGYAMAYRYRPDNLSYALSYATGLYRNDQFTEAEEPFKRILAAYRELANTDPNALADVASTLNNLGALYGDLQRLPEAERAFEEALKIYRTMAVASPAVYLPDVALALNNLGSLYNNTRRQQQAEMAYDEALKTYRMLARTDPGANLPYVASTLNNFGSLYKNTQRLPEAEKAYDEALKIYRQMAETDPNANLPDVASMLNNLGALYGITRRLAEEEKAYYEALQIRRKLAQTNPDANLPDVALNLNYLGALYSDTQRLPQAEQAYNEALSIRRKLAEINPSANLSEVALILNDLGAVYGDTQRLPEAEKAFNEALKIARALAETNPSAYLSDVAMTLNNLASLYADTQRLPEAGKAYEEAVKIRRDQAEYDPAVKPKVAAALHILGLFYQKTGRTAEAEAAFKEESEIMASR
jgi:tetratricopeptide (TPR) repeat protein